FHQRLAERVPIVGQWHRYTKFLADLVGFLEDDLEYRSIDGVVRAVEQRRTHHAPLLPEAIDASLALLVARGIPREIVVNDRVEVVLEVHTLGEAVGGDEDALPCIAQQLDFLL